MYGLEFKRVVVDALRKYQWAKLIFTRPMAKNWVRLLVRLADDGHWPIDIFVPMKKTQGQLDDAFLIEAVKVIKGWKPKGSV